MADTQEEHSHPGPGEYIQIGIILAIITAVEVALYYLDVIRVVVIPSLLFLTIVKFVLVILWFMHLRFDSPWFRRLFFAGLGLALAVFAAVVAMQYFANVGNVVL